MMKDFLDHSLLAHNTFGIEARCHRFIEFSTVEEAQAAAGIVREAGLPLLIVGEGSNLLLTRDFPGIVLHSAIKEREATLQADGNIMLRCGSGETWDDIVAFCVEKGH